MKIDSRTKVFFDLNHPHVSLSENNEVRGKFPQKNVTT